MNNLNLEKITYGSERHKEIIESMNRCSECGKPISFETSNAYENGMCTECMMKDYNEYYSQKEPDDFKEYVEDYENNYLKPYNIKNKERYYE